MSEATPPHTTDEARELMAGVEAGDIPLTVYADFLEENADPLAMGVRWLALRERRPRFIGRSWGYEWDTGSDDIWETPSGTCCQLPGDLTEFVPRYHPTEVKTFDFALRIHDVARVLVDIFGDLPVDQWVELPDSVQPPEVRIDPFYR